MKNKMRQRFGSFFVGVVVAIGLIPGSAAAQDFGVWAGANVHPHYFDSYAPGSTSTSSAAGPYTWGESTGGSSSGGARGNAGIGSLGAFADAKTTNEFMDGWIVMSGAGAVFWDILTVGSNSLPNGTPVTLVFTVGLTGHFSQNGASWGQAETHLIVSNFWATSVYRDVFGNTRGSDTVLVPATVGSMLRLEGRLNVWAQARRSSSITTAFGDTARFFVDSQTPGVVITGSSGYRYNSVTEPPTITAPTDVISSTTDSSCDSFVDDATLGQATVNGGGPLSITRSGVPAGNFFPRGATTVTYTVTDAAGQTATATQVVTVIDDTPAVVMVPASIVTGNDSGTCWASVNPGVATATDNCGLLSVVGKRNDALPLGAPYPIGTTTIGWEVKDTSGNATAHVQTVTVKDVEAPVISQVDLNQTVLWPPNHKMVDIYLGYTVLDNCDATPGITRSLEVRSSEPSDGVGDGDTSPDWEIVDHRHVRLRAERSGKGSGRIYTILITASDSKGNASTETVSVTVPHRRN